MKKLIPVLAVALVGTIAFSSCKKSYTCTCKDKSGTQTAKYDFGKTKKDAATSACNVYDAAQKLSSAGGSCSL